MRVFDYDPACISVSFVFGALAGFIIYRAWKAKSAIWAFILVFLGVVLWVVIAHEISDAIYRQAWW